jgi:hypothetical protein
LPLPIAPLAGAMRCGAVVAQFWRGELFLRLVVLPAHQRIGGSGQSLCGARRTRFSSWRFGQRNGHREGARF